MLAAVLAFPLVNSLPKVGRALFSLFCFSLTFFSQLSRSFMLLREQTAAVLPGELFAASSHPSTYTTALALVFLSCFCVRSFSVFFSCAIFCLLLLPFKVVSRSLVVSCWRCSLFVFVEEGEFQKHEDSGTRVTCHCRLRDDPLGRSGYHNPRLSCVD